jgi:tight adherence protein B
MSLGILAALIFVVATGAIVGIYMVFAGHSSAAMQKTVDERLQEVSGFAPEAETEAKGTLIRVQSAGPLPHVDRMTRRAIKGSAIEKWLEQSGTGMSPSTYFLISLLLGTIAGTAIALLSHRLWTSPLGFMLGASLPAFYLRFKRTRRINKFEEHFPEALDLISRAVRAGHAFSAGMKMVSDELSEPVGPEFRKAFDEQNYGLPLKESLNNLANRVPLLDVRFFATAVLIQRETGGNLSEILDNLAAVVRERFKIRRQVRVHTAHGRFTGYVLLALPAFLAFTLLLINPDHMKLLFDERIGQMMIVATIFLQAVGFIWIKQVVKIEV